MNILTSMKYKHLYPAWALLFAATVLLGLIFPAAEGALKYVLRLIAALFFIPPWLILLKSQDRHGSKHRKLIRNLSIASLLSTLVLICASVMAVGDSAVLGDALHAALTVVSAPMICCQSYALSMFLWAMLLMATLSRPKK